MEIYNEEDDVVILSKEEYDSLIERNNFLDGDAWDLYDDLCEEDD